MQRAYRIIQHDMNNIFTNPYVVNHVVRLRDPQSGYGGACVPGLRSGFAAFTRSPPNSAPSWSAPCAAGRGSPRCSCQCHRSRRRVGAAVPSTPCGVASCSPWRRSSPGHKLLSAGRWSIGLSAAGPAGIAAAPRPSTDGDLAEEPRRRAQERERQAALGALVPAIAHDIRDPARQHPRRGPAPGARRAPGRHEDAGGHRDRRSPGRWVTAPRLVPASLAAASGRHRALGDGPAAVGLLGPRLQEKGIRVDEKALYREEPRVPMDVDLMEQALAGFLANAIEASPADA